MKDYKEMYKALCAKNEELASELREVREENSNLKYRLAKYPAVDVIHSLEQKLKRVDEELKDAILRARKAEAEIDHAKAEEAKAKTALKAVLSNKEEESI